MAAIITTDIFCDGNLLGYECSQWLHGAVGDRIKMNEARANAKEGGWTTIRHSYKWLDICPNCREEMGKQ